MIEFEAEDDEDTSAASTVEPGAILSLLKDNKEHELSEGELENCSEDDEDIGQNKENELQACGKLNASQLSSQEKLENSKLSQEETANYESDSLQRRTSSPEKLQKQGVLTSHSLNVSHSRTATNTSQSVETGLGELFGYKRSAKTRKLDDIRSVLTQEKANSKASIPVQPIEVIDIDSGYLSDTEMSTDGDTPTPAPSAVARLTPFSSGGNLPLRQGSAVGTKVK